MTFADLHRPGHPFVLPNAWDLASAGLLARQDFPAIGTTSLGVAAAHGLVDGSRAAREATARLAHDITAARLGRYVTVDIEDGFSDDPAAVAEFVAGLGVDGVNIEDSTRGELIAPDLAARKIVAIKTAAPTVFVNARTDVHWLGGSDLHAALDRLSAYADAGADGVFLPGTADPGVIETVALGIARPLNVLATPALTRRRLGNLGVARISTGSLLYRSALERALDTALAVRDGSPFPPAIPYGEVQDLAE
ncbi:isocitrate lyase/PEP mutase family protein [Nocardiopsis lambiniae]|uniref:Isocitrate lyase/phosphoenolpyruvate mutase family protein n=1 Tax=Nocardiopsis lambiniae TaxID=3075539 RepID=A0ABU2M773_9ACTN|nr:isocitrate lyase/phosphoenolpyruvate mutase family protein [Nocardiopsis sp. DSM 44743]MDT0328438.1 isocitrate lyase/phosphoenolpyruvate mutase family protein [Nocardiopsis sp. DSM 44743]